MRWLWLELLIKGDCLINGSKRYCKCHQGYSGEYCEEEICKKLNCSVQSYISFDILGSCVFENNEYFCKCKKGFRGLNCDIINCSIINCENGIS